MYVPRKLRLKDPELIARWELLVEYAKRTPKLPSALFYRSAITTDWSVAAYRMARAESFVFFMEIPDEEMQRTSGTPVGGDLTFVSLIHKISTSHPFIFRDVSATPMTIDTAGRVQYAKNRDIKDSARSRLKMARKTSVYQPDTEELDELLAFLKDADPIINENTFRKR